MSMSVKYDDVELNTMIDVEVGFNPLEGADWHRDLVGVGNANGSNLVSSRFGHKVITMPYRMKGNVRSNYDKLQKVLNSKEPKKLIFGSIPNRYYMAVSSGTSDFKEVSAGFLGHGTITWIVPSGVSESIETKIVPVQLVNGILTANIDYTGSADAFPVFRIKHNDENGYIGAASSSGTALELGNRETVDTEKRSEAKVILNTTDFSEFKRFTGTNPENPAKGNTGSSSVSKEGDTNYLKLSNTGTNNNFWHGSSNVFDFPADGTGHVGTKNMYCYYNSVFWAGAIGQTAQMQVLFLDAKNQLVMGYDIYKNDIVGNTGVWTALVGDGKGGVVTKRTETFTTSHLDWQNPFNKPRGHADIYKKGSTVRFYWFGGYPQFVVPELKDVEITKCMVNQYVFGSRAGAQQMSYFDFRNMMIRNDNSKFIYDIKNRYAKGSEITVYNGSGEIYVNGLPANNELVDGSEFLRLKPGKNKIEFYASSWVKSKPTITVEYKERWL